MAESPRSDSSFRNTEEDWPDPDVDSSTEEGQEIARRSEASLFKSMDREARQRRRAIQAAYGNLPASLYDKARDHQDELTDAERQLLLSRGDVIGKALAYPDSLTIDEIHEASGWPPPDVVRANIQRATNGELSTPFELYAKAKEALENGQFETIISYDAACLVAHSFYSQDDYSPSKCMERHGIPGFGHALNLLSRRLGLDIAVFKACGTRSFEPRERPTDVEFPDSDPQHPSAATPAAPQGQPSQGRSPGELLDAMASVQEQFRRGTLSEKDFLARMRSILDAMRANVPSRLTPFTPPPIPRGLLQPGVPQPSQADLVGSGPWPPSSQSVGAYNMFRDETDPSGWGYSAAAEWAALPEDQKEVYRGRAEARRNEAWAGYERRLAHKDAGLPPPPPPPQPQPQPVLPQPAVIMERVPQLAQHNPKPVLLLSGFEVFRNEVVATCDSEGALGFGEVRARWEALGDEQRATYEVRAWEERKAAMAAMAAPAQ